MNKIKNWIKFKLLNFLGIYKIKDDIYGMKLDIEQVFETRKRIVDVIYSKINHLEESNKVLHTTMENIIHIGTDVHYNPSNNHSWAVICIEGKMNIVKFVDLNGRYARDILDYLKQFEAGRHCIDSPSKYIFEQELFKF